MVFSIQNDFDFFCNEAFLFHLSIVLTHSLQAMYNQTVTYTECSLKPKFVHTDSHVSNSTQNL